MDKIYIENLEIYAHHGVYEEERKLGQRFVVSLVLETETRKAGQSDDLEQTMNYGAVAREVTAIVQEENYFLLERVAEVIAHRLLLAHRLLKQVTVKVKKPWAPVGLPLETVGVEITRAWHDVYLGLGSNLGDREAYLESAFAALRDSEDIELLGISAIRETEPYGYTEQPPFLNACAHIRTLLAPQELLGATQAIEASARRERLIHWGPRTLDIDILFYDQEIIGTKDLVVPHPELEKRRFVLEPMQELAPWLRHPVTHKTIRQILEELE